MFVALTSVCVRVIVQPLPGNGLGSMMNDARDPKRNNCRFQLVPDSRTGQINLVVLALRLIYPGEELFVSYGHGYWKSFEDEASDAEDDDDDAASEHSETSSSNQAQAVCDSPDEQDAGAGSHRESAVHLHAEHANDRDALASMSPSTACAAVHALPLHPIRIDRTVFHEYVARSSQDLASAADEFAISAIMEKCIRVWSPSLCCFVAAGSPMPTYSRGQAAWRRYCRFLVRMAVHFNERARELLISACLELSSASSQTAPISIADPRWKWLLGAMNASNDWAASIGVTVRGLVNSHFNKQTIFTGLSSGEDSSAPLVLTSVLSAYCKASSSAADSPETRLATSQCSLCSDEFLTSAAWSPAAGCSHLHKVMPLCSSCEKKVVNGGIRNLLGMSTIAVNDSAETPQSASNAGSPRTPVDMAVFTRAELFSSPAWVSLSFILARSLRPCSSVDAAIALIPPSAMLVSSRLAEIWRSDAGVADTTSLSSHSSSNSKSEASRAQEEPEIVMTPPYLPEWDPLCPHCMQSHVDRLRWIVSDESCSDAGTEDHMESFADVLTLGLPEYESAAGVMSLIAIATCVLTQGNYFSKSILFVTIVWFVQICCGPCALPFCGCHREPFACRAVRDCRQLIAFERRNPLLAGLHSLKTKKSLCCECCMPGANSIRNRLPSSDTSSSIYTDFVKAYRFERMSCRFQFLINCI